MNIGIDIDDTITETYSVLIPMIALKYGMDLNKLLVQKPNYSSLYNLAPEYPELLQDIARVVPLKTGVVEVLQKLREQGHKIIFISARNREEYDDPYSTSYNYLVNNGVPFDKLITNCSDKGNQCIVENIDLFIDDSTMNCKAVQKKGIKVWQFDAKFTVPSKDLERVNSWEDIYKKIEEMYA